MARASSMIGRSRRLGRGVGALLLASTTGLVGAAGCELVAGIDERQLDVGGHGGTGATSSGGQGGSTATGGGECGGAPLECQPTELSQDEARWPDSTPRCFAGESACQEGEDGFYDGRRGLVDNQNNETATDEVTGLVWQRHETWLPGDHATAATLCENSDLADLEDWRLPTYLELLSLVDYGRETLLPELIDTVGVPNDIDRPTGLWMLDVGGPGNPGDWHYYAMFGPRTDGIAGFDGGEVTWGGQLGLIPSPIRYARCVHGAGPLGAPVLVDGCDPDMVRDPRTALEWQASPSPDVFGWQQALAHCRELCDNGGGWRLASVKELGTLFRADSVRGVIGPFPSVGTGTGAVFWTSTPSIKVQTEVFILNFAPVDAYDYPINTAAPANAHRAWCVRGYRPS